MLLRMTAIALLCLAGVAEANTEAHVRAQTQVRLTAARIQNIGTIPGRLMADLQRDIGLAEHQAAAIAGNLAQETGNFTLLQERGGPGVGYSQWNGSRKREFLGYAASRGGRSSYEANYGFVLLELRRDYPDLLQVLRRTGSVEEATSLFMREFLRPNRKHAALAKRVGYAEAFLDATRAAGNMEARAAVPPGFRPVARPEAKTPAKGAPALRMAMAD